MRIRLMVAWYDMWVGAFWDRIRHRLYIFPLPMIGLQIQFGTPPAEVDWLLSIQRSGAESKQAHKRIAELEGSLAEAEAKFSRIRMSYPIVDEREKRFEAEAERDEWQRKYELERGHVLRGPTGGEWVRRELAEETITKAEAELAERDEFLSRGYVKNCFLTLRPGEEALFYANEHGIIPMLDGYRIEPLS